jgi:hypothetical protein
MRTLLACTLLLAATCCYQASAQEETKTTETTVSVDSATGKSTTTYSTTVSRSEDIRQRQNVITIDPLKLLFWWNISYYRALNNSIAIGAGIQAPTGFLALGSDDVDISGFGVKAEMRWYPSGKAIRGFYVAPNVAFSSLSAELTNSSGTATDGGSATTWTLGLLVGWQWLPGDDFAIGLGLGADKYFLSVSDEEDTSSFDGLDAVLPAFRFDIGYAW